MPYWHLGRVLFMYLRGKSGIGKRYAMRNARLSRNRKGTLYSTCNALYNRYGEMLSHISIMLYLARKIYSCIILNANQYYINIRSYDFLMQQYKIKRYVCLPVRKVFPDSTLPDIWMTAIMAGLLSCLLKWQIDQHVRQAMIDYFQFVMDKQHFLQSGKRLITL